METGTLEVGRRKNGKRMKTMIGKRTIARTGTREKLTIPGISTTRKKITTTGAQRGITMAGIQRKIATTGTTGTVPLTIGTTGPGRPLLRTATTGSKRRSLAHER